jgi:hypothetical protein
MPILRIGPIDFLGGDMRETQKNNTDVACYLHAIHLPRGAIDLNDLKKPPSGDWKGSRAAGLIENQGLFVGEMWCEDLDGSVKKSFGVACGRRRYCTRPPIVLRRKVLLYIHCVGRAAATCQQLSAQSADRPPSC